MKTCPKCGETSEDQFDSCWQCATPFSSAEAGVESAAPPIIKPKPARRTAFKLFRGTFASWDSLCTEAAQFATGIGPQDLITISHSEDDCDAVIIVWYWTVEPKLGEVP